jgi:hypothetical protein
LQYALQDEKQTATQGQTAFTLTTLQYIPGTNSLAVFVNGSKQIVTLNYAETSTTLVTFVSGLNVGDVVEFITAVPVSTNSVSANQVGCTGEYNNTATNVQDQLNNININTAMRGVFNGFKEKAIYDTFERADGLLQGSTTSSGQTWVLSGAGASSAAIINNCYTATSNTYAYLPYGELIKNIGCSFSFSPASSGSTDLTIQNLTLIADNALIGLATMLHLIVSPSGWALQKRLSGGAFVVIVSGSHSLLINGAVYQVSMRINGNTVIVSAPNGQEYSVTDTDISSINPQFGGWQIQNGSVNAATTKFMR